MEIFVFWLKFHMGLFDISFGLGNGLVPSRQQAFNWINDDM